MFRIIKWMLPAIATLFLVASTGNRASASHLAAGEIFLTYIGEGADGCGTTLEYKYQITVNIFRACDGGASAPTSITVNWGSVSAGLDTTLPMSDPFRDTLSELCEAYVPQNSCIFPANEQTFPAFILHQFIDTLILPSAQRDWLFSWSSCCRNGSILNGSANGGYYVETVLNNFDKYNNSTPRFTFAPLPYVCIDQPVKYANGPFDPNNDSIFTTIQEPLTAPGATIPYGGAPYSFADPVGVAAGTQFQFDGFSGTASFTPANQGKFVMAFKVEEFDKTTGRSLGYVFRDIQLSVFPCNAPPPAADSIPSSSDLDDGEVVTVNQRETVVACPGSELKIRINSESASPTSQVYMYANDADFDNATFTVAGFGTSAATGEFVWTPTEKDYGDHLLKVLSNDSTCSGTQFAIVLKTLTEVPIRVIPSLDAGPDIPVCREYTDSVQLFVVGAQSFDNPSINWSVAGGGPVNGMSNTSIHNPKVFPDRTTDYIIHIPELVGECKNRDTVSVFIDTTNTLTITPKNPEQPEEALVMCQPGYLQLEGILTGLPPKDNVQCGTVNPTTCQNPDSTFLYGSPVFGRVRHDTSSLQAPLLFNNYRTAKMEYLINRSELRRNNVFSSTLRSISFETGGNNTDDTLYGYSNFRILVKCTDKDSLSAKEGFSNFGMTEVYSTPAIQFFPGMHNFKFTEPYNLDTTKNLIVQICYSENDSVEAGCGVSTNPLVIAYSSTTYKSGLKYVPDNAATASVCGVGQAPGILEVSTRPAFGFTYCEVDPQLFVIEWTNGEYLSDSTILQPLAYVPQSTKFVVHTNGRSNCITSDSIEVYIPEHDYSISPEDTAFCLGDEAPFFISGGGHFFRWYEYDNGQFLPPNSVNVQGKGAAFISPQQSTEYRIVISDTVFCFDTLSANIEILPLPDVRILNEDDTTVKFGSSFQLLASGARFYNWSPVSSLNNPNISYPVAHPTEDTKYIVGGIGTNGCRAFDTLNVIVDKRDNLFVPSAFSPNGDGKNDLFRVTNLSFQRIMEFRVFNRWGQEVFSTNDSRGGWDGTWAGVPQEMGTYNYLIRVAYPDGFVETYRGETTLIR